MYGRGDAEHELITLKKDRFSVETFPVASIDVIFKRAEHIIDLTRHYVKYHRHLDGGTYVPME